MMATNTDPTGGSPTLVLILDTDVIAGVQSIGQVKVVGGCRGQKVSGHCLIQKAKWEV